MKISEKALENNTVVSLWIVDYYIVYEFKEEFDARNFYNSINIDEGSRVPIFQLLKMKLCKHKNKRDVLIRDTHKYEVCSKCKKSKYVNTENPDQIAYKQTFNEIKFLEIDIKEVEESILQNEFTLKKKEREIKENGKKLKKLGVRLE